jgi:small subunit ribosomal protein S5e
MAVRIIQHTLEIIHLLTDQNLVVVDAIINSGPGRITRVGGPVVIRRQAVDMSPFRRVNTPSTCWRLAPGASPQPQNHGQMPCRRTHQRAARGSSNSYAIKKG